MLSAFVNVVWECISAPGVFAATQLSPPSRRCFIPINPVQVPPQHPQIIVPGPLHMYIYMVVVRQTTELHRLCTGKSNIHGMSYFLSLYHTGPWKPLSLREWWHRKVDKNAAGTVSGKKKNLKLYCMTVFLHMWEHFRNPRSNNCFPFLVLPSYPCC